MTHAGRTECMAAQRARGQGAWAAPLAVLALSSLGGCSTPAPPPAAAPPLAAPAPPEPPAPPSTTGVAAAPAAPGATAVPASVEPAPPAPPAPSPCPEGMALISGGDYVFGPTKEKVTVKPFCLDVNEVTVGAYATCVNAGKCDKSFVTVCDPITYGKDGTEKLPMACVDFKQAETYCAAQGARLPSAEEWEWAARGGAEARKRPWGDGDLGDQLCWLGKEKRTGPCAVGSFPAGNNPQGVHDLLGNVGEWTTSRSDATSSIRYARGGSWKDSAKELFRVDRPGVFKATYRCGFVGIRCAKPAP